MIGPLPKLLMILTTTKLWPLTICCWWGNNQPYLQVCLRKMMSMQVIDGNKFNTWWILSGTVSVDAGILTSPAGTSAIIQAEKKLWDWRHCSDCGFQCQTLREMFAACVRRKAAHWIDLYLQDTSSTRSCLTVDWMEVHAVVVPSNLNDSIVSTVLFIMVSEGSAGGFLLKSIIISTVLSTFNSRLLSKWPISKICLLQEAVWL